jgi:predicted DNA-binding transcriptional regulator AlpA
MFCVLGRSTEDFCMAKKPLRMLTWADLRARGISYHTNHLRRMWGDGRFPPPTHLSPRKLVWRESDIERWLASKIDEEAA